MNGIPTFPLSDRPEFRGRVYESILAMADKMIVVNLPDFAESYLSTSLFDGLSRETDGVAA